MDFLGKIIDKANATANGLKKQYGFGDDGLPWPTTSYNPITTDGGLNLYPKYKTKGFLPPVKISPILDNLTTVGQYTYKDWRGHILSLNNNIRTTKEKFETGSIPKSNTNDLIDSPYSTRDSYLIFDDNTTDYFKHGLQVINNLTPIENPESGFSNLRSDIFTSTPFENNDPVIYGFEIIMDDISSPLLNGSISDFIRNYSNIAEVAERAKIYEEFKQQFVKFFKTKASVRIDSSSISGGISNMGISTDNVNRNVNILQNGKLSYLNYYLKKIDGLDKLVEQNTPKLNKSLAAYNDDVIQLSFSEDVSLSVGTLAHLYKLLYWSKPNSKTIIPENLLRFNCDIIVSEVRNFNRVRKAINTDGSKSFEVIKDNVSRYIYSLKECQLYFNNMTHASSIDMGGITPYTEGGYTIQFDYKFSTSKLERFVPTTNGFGQYVGYDNGAMWKIGNSGERDKRKTGGDVDTSVPKFFTVGGNKLNQTGVDTPFVFSKPEDNLFRRTDFGGVETLDNFKKKSAISAKELLDRLGDVAIRAATRELQTTVNVRTAILNKTLNKVLNSVGLNSMRPPRNVYTDKDLNAGERIFYDIRGELVNFAGGAIGSVLGGGITGGGYNPR